MPDYGDYFDLVARAIARVEADTTVARQRIYEYARHAQSLQLQNFDPRITATATAIRRERNALEEAIRRIEIAASQEPTIVETWQMLLDNEEPAERPRRVDRLIDPWRRSRA